MNQYLAGLLFSRQQRGTAMSQDRIEGTARNLGGKVEEGFGRATGDVKSQVEGKIRQAAGTAQDLYGQARDTANDAAAAVQRQASSFEETVRDAIETRPYTAVAIALAFGWFVGRLGRSY
jgi:uncharacterized protein YjbJ (UPF0337 family)